MKRIAMLLVLLLAVSAQAQVYELTGSSTWLGDTVAISAGSGVTLSMDSLSGNLLYWNAFNDGFVQPGREYKIVRTDSSIMLVEKGCWTKWLDSDSVSHCGHEIRNGPVDSTFEHGRFLTAITKIYWCETDESEFRITTKIDTKKAE